VNPYEVHLYDEGYDVSAIAQVNELSRTNDAATVGNVWQGSSMLSIGSKKIDSAYAASGPATYGLDLSGLNYTAPVAVAAVLIRGNDSICMDASNTTTYSRYATPGPACMKYNTGTAAFEANQPLRARPIPAPAVTALPSPAPVVAVMKQDGTPQDNTWTRICNVVTAGGTTVTVSFTGGAQRSDANYMLTIQDDTVLEANLVPATKTATGFTFTSVNTRVYSYCAEGA
jgi:hypothetical protein